MPNNPEPAKPAPATKFQPGQTVYRVEKNSSWGNYGVAIEGLSYKVVFYPATVKKAEMVVRYQGYGFTGRTAVWKEMLSLEFPNGQVRHDVPATRAYVWTQAQYDAVKDEYEAGLIAKAAANDAAAAHKLAFLNTFVAWVAAHPGEAVERLMDGSTFLQHQQGICTTCWREHERWSGKEYDHEPTSVEVPA